MSTSVTDGVDTQDDSYVSRTGQSTIPVQKDSAAVEDPIDPATADSDQQLGKLFLCMTAVFSQSSFTQSIVHHCKYLTNDIIERDDAEAIDESNIIGGGRTRGAKPSGTYREPGDEEGLPGPEDGTSSTR